MDHKKAVWIVAFISIATWALVVLTSPHGHNDRADFFGSYTAAQILRSHPHLLYSVPLQLSLQRAAGSWTFAPWAHPAPEAILFAPLTRLTPSHAFAVWTAVSICCFVLSYSLLAEELGSLESGGHYALMALCGVPILEGLWLGQDHGLFLLLWVLAWRFLKEKHDFKAGLFIGLSLIQFQFAVPMLLFLLVLRGWRLVAGVAASGSLLVVATFLIVGRGLLVGYLGMLQFTANTTDKIFVTYMPDIRGFASFVFPTHSWIVTSIGVAGVLIFALCVIRGMRPDHGLAFAIIVSLLVDPHAFCYDLVILAIPMAHFLRICPAVAVIGWSFCALVFAQFVDVGILALFCPFLLAWAAWATRIGINRCPAAGVCTNKDTCCAVTTPSDALVTV